MTDKRLYALDQNGNKLFAGDTVFRKIKNSRTSFADGASPPDKMFYVITRIEPDYAPKQGHHYERKDMPDGGLCSYISVDGPEGNYPKWGSWYADDFVFSCRGE